MKKVLIAVLAVLLCFGAVLGFASCKEDEQETTKTKVDINLANMSDTMAYTTLYDIQENPTGYEGKTIKVKGYFSRDTFRGGSKVNHYFISVYNPSCGKTDCIARTTFVWDGDLPDRGTETTVTGVVVVKRENGNDYPELQATSVKF